MIFNNYQFIIRRMNHMVRSENQVANPVRTNIELSEKVLELNKQLEQEPENAELWI